MKLKLKQPLQVIQTSQYFTAQQIAKGFVTFDPSDPQVGLTAILVSFPHQATYPGI